MKDGGVEVIGVELDPLPVLEQVTKPDTAQLDTVPADTEPGSTPMDVDEVTPPEQIEKDLRRMSISSHTDTAKLEHKTFETDISIDEIDRVTTRETMTGHSEIQYSLRNRSTTARNEESIDVDDEEQPSSISAAIKKRYHSKTTCSKDI